MLYGVKVVHLCCLVGFFFSVFKGKWYKFFVLPKINKLKLWSFKLIHFFQFSFLPNILLNLYIRSPIWLEHSCCLESVDTEVSIWTSPFSVYATLTALQFEHSGEPPRKHSLIVFVIPPGCLAELQQVLTLCGV